MERYTRLLSAFLILFMVLTFCLLFFGLPVSEWDGYRNGQLDYQRGEIQYILQDDGTYYVVHDEL